jgi:predicted transcriptional regulator
VKARELIKGEQEVVTPRDSVAKAARLMRGRGVAVLGVVEDREGQQALGAISDRHLLTDCVAAGHEPRRCPIWNHVQQAVRRIQADQDVELLAAEQDRPMLDRPMVLVVDGDRLVGVVEPPSIAAALAERPG